LADIVSVRVGFDEFAEFLFHSSSRK
jgi:hypothetical protein